MLLWLFCLCCCFLSLLSMCDFVVVFLLLRLCRFLCLLYVCSYFVSLSVLFHFVCVVRCCFVGFFDVSSVLHLCRCHYFDFKLLTIFWVVMSLVFLNSLLFNCSHDAPHYNYLMDFLISNSNIKPGPAPADLKDKLWRSPTQLGFLCICWLDKTSSPSCR